MCMRNIVFLIGWCLCGVSSWAQTGSFDLKIDNVDPMGIGFVYVDDDQGIGPRSVAVFGRSVYIPDPVHGNIKVLDVESGMVRIIDIGKGGNLGMWLRDIVYCNGSVFVTSDTDGVYVIDSGGRVENIEMPEGDKYFAGVRGDTIIIYMPVGRRMMGLVQGYQGYRVVDYVQGEYDMGKYTKGKPYMVKKGPDLDSIVVSWGVMELPGRYQDISRYYDGINVDYTDDCIVYYSIDLDRGNMRVMYVCR